MGARLGRSLTLREEHRLRVFENRVLRKFGPRRYEDGSWKRMHDDELNSLYSSPNTITVIRSRRMKGVGHVTCIEGERRQVFAGSWLGGPKT